MGSLGLAGKRRLLLVLALSAPVLGVLVAFASATGPAAGITSAIGAHPVPTR